MAIAPEEVARLEREHGGKSAEEITSWAIRTHGRKAAIASSFGAEDVVLIDMAVKASSDARIFTLDTGRLPDETYQTIDAIRRKYGVKVEIYFPDKSAVERLTTEKGLFSFRESVPNRQECCRIRRVEPLGRALKGAEAWLTGLRREQSTTRSDLRVFEADSTQGGLLKISPLAAWSEPQVWDYIKKNGVPYNRLHDAGYRSIGCAPCTRPVKEGEDVRSGRWWWESPDHKECGLHPGHRPGQGPSENPIAGDASAGKKW